MSKKHKSNFDTENEDECETKRRKVVKKEFIFDMIYDIETAKRFIKFYKPYVDDTASIDSDDEFTVVSNRLDETIKMVVEQNLWKKIVADTQTIRDKKIGDVVKVTYMPASQRYLDFYETKNFIGEIIFIDSERDNAFLIQMDTDDNTKIVIRTLDVDGCHFFGMSRGYDYFID